MSGLSSLRLDFSVIGAMACGLALGGCVMLPLGQPVGAAPSSAAGALNRTAQMSLADRDAMRFDFQAEVACRKAEKELGGFKTFLHARIPELDGVVERSSVEPCHRDVMGFDRYGRPVTTFRTAVSYFPSAPFPRYEDGFAALAEQACARARAQHQLAGQLRQQHTGMPPMPTANAVQCYQDERQHRFVIDVLRPQGS